MPATTILFLDAGDRELELPRKLAGIRRFARTRGWRVEVFRRRDVPPSAVAALLRRFHPAGCVVEDSGPSRRLEPGLFAKVPVVWLDPHDPARRGGRAHVACDQESVAAAAFRELSSGVPPCYAVVPSPSLPAWNRRRIAAFASLCEKEGKPCRVFPGRANEEEGNRSKRLAAWLAGLPAHVAVFAANDFTAKGVADAAARLRLRFPRDYTLVGVDAIPETFAETTTPGISSVELDCELAGYMAAKMLDGLVADPHGPGREPPSATFGPLLVVRKESTRGRGRRERRILEAVEMIRREACEGLTAAVLTSRFPGSRKHFERRFREATGHSVLDAILHVRLQAAVDLLSRPGPSIGSISDFCGFSTARELQKLFRARFGMSMREWRALHGR